MNNCSYIIDITAVSFICASIFEDCQITIYIGTWWIYDVFIYIFRLCLCAYTIKKFIAHGFTLLDLYNYTKQHLE